MTEKQLAKSMSDTSIRVSDELADELYERKSRGDSYEDVIWRALFPPGEYRVDCGECGFDGGTYDYGEGDAPAYCPRCGTAVSESDKIVTPPAEDEPTSLGWPHAKGKGK